MNDEEQLANALHLLDMVRLKRQEMEDRANGKQGTDALYFWSPSKNVVIPAADGMLFSLKAGGPLDKTMTADKASEIILKAVAAGEEDDVWESVFPVEFLLRSLQTALGLTDEQE